MTDSATAPTTTHRAIGRRRIAAGEARTAVIRRHYDAPVADVWAACTEPDRLNRWFLPVSGDLRAGGTFHLEGNASGTILRCEPPHLLTLTWASGDRPVDEVELRLAPGADGGTILELTHASVSDVFLTDPETGLFGVGVGWELPLTYLTRYLRGELPDMPASEWYEYTPADAELANQAGAAWTAVVKAADTTAAGSPAAGKQD